MGFALHTKLAPQPIGTNSPHGSFDHVRTVFPPQLENKLCLQHIYFKA